MIKETEYKGYTLHWASRRGYWSVYKGEALVISGFKAKALAAEWVDAKVDMPAATYPTRGDPDLYNRQRTKVRALDGKEIVADLQFSNGSTRTIRGKLVGGTGSACGFLVLPSGMDSVAWPTSVQYSEVSQIVEAP